MWVMKVPNYMPAIENSDVDPLSEWANKDLPARKGFEVSSDMILL